MNILYLNTTYQCGGAEKVTAQLFHGMKHRGHQVYQIVSYDMRNAKLPQDVHVIYHNQAMRIFNRLITGNHSNQNQRIWYSREYIASFIKRHAIDVIHLHNPHDNFLGIEDIKTLAKLRPVVWTLHDFWAMTGHCTYPYGCDDRWKKGCLTCDCLGNYPALRKDVAAKLYQAKKKAFLEEKIAFTVPSQWMQEQFESSHLRGQYCQCIYNSLDTNIWQPLDKQKVRAQYQLDVQGKVLGFIAADPQKKLKGMDLLLEALAQLKDPEDYLVLVAGRENHTFDKLRTKFQIRHLGYLKTQKELNEFYAMADVLVNPSVYETFGLTNIEAMAAQTPVIAFPVCTMPELVDKSCGWIAKEVSAAALAEVIQKAFLDPGILKEKGIASRAKAVQCFSEEVMLQQFEELYKTLVISEKEHHARG